MDRITIQCSKDQALNIFTLTHTNCINGNRQVCTVQPGSCSECPYNPENIEFKISGEE